MRLAGGYLKWTERKHLSSIVRVYVSSLRVFRAEISRVRGWSRIQIASYDPNSDEKGMAPVELMTVSARE